MQVRVTLHSVLKNGQFAQGKVALADGATLRDLIAALGIQVEEVGVITVNQQIAPYAQRLAEEDQISILPFISGG